MATSFATEAIGARPKDEEHEVLSNWAKKWSENAIGWHKGSVHESLLKYGGKIIPGFADNDDDTCTAEGNGVRVLVPLCGKTLDMAFFAEHKNVKEVVGMDGIGKALEEFASEHPSLGIQSLPPKGDSYERYGGPKITLLKGDFFDANDASTTNGPVDAVWDRGSMVAIDPKLRPAYVDILGNLIRPGGTILVATLERRTGTDEARQAGPPFSISESDLRAIYEPKDWVESVILLEEIDEFERSPERREAMTGVTSMYELIFVIQTKAKA